MKFYKDEEEEKFFENKRFSDSKLPTYGDIKFILKDILKQNLNNEDFEKIKDATITKDIWNRIKPIIYYNYENTKLQNLRQTVFAKNSNYNNLIAKNEVFTFENFKYKDDKTLADSLKDVNLQTFSSMYEYFSRGENIGTCGLSSRLIGVMFKNVKSCVGKIKEFENTPKSEDGTHAWIEVNHKGKEYVVDTSLLIVVPMEHAKQLGYQPEKRYDIEDFIDENSYFGDILYTHYNESTKLSTKDKASYEQFCEYREKINIKEKEEMEER